MSGLRPQDAGAQHVSDASGDPPVLRRTLTRAARRALGLARSMGSSRKELEETKRRLKQAERRNERLTQRYRQANQQLKKVSRDYLLCKVPGGSVCAEIGVHEGEFSRQIFDVVRPELLHLIDPWKQGEGLFGDQVVREQAAVEERYEKVKERFAEELGAGRVRIHRALSDEIAGDFPDSYFDWIYIDGNHLYEFVKRDLELYYPKVKHGGYVAGDDYGVKGYWDNGVQRAVDEFVSQEPEAVLEVKARQFIVRKGSAEE